MQPQPRSLANWIATVALILMTVSNSYGADLEVQSWRCSTEYNYVYVKGMVKNISPDALRNVTVVGTFLDKSGEYINHSDALVEYDPILPGQVSPFRTGVRLNPAINNCQIGFKKLFGAPISYTTKRSSSRGGPSGSGMSSAEQLRVQKAQRLLNELGYDAGPVDGRIGPKTRAAIRTFQKNHKYSVTGVVDDDLVVRLKQELPAARAKADAESLAYQQATKHHEELRAAQQLLNKLGYDTGAATGFAGPKTRDAIRAFQRDAELPVTGEVNAELLRRLKEMGTR